MTSSNIRHRPAAVPDVIAAVPDLPIMKVSTATGDHAWLVQDYQLARQLLNDPRLSRAAAARAGAPALNSTNPVADSLTTRDGAHHQQLRRHVTGWFTQRRMAAFVPFIERTAADLTAGIAARRPPVDLISAYATPLALSVLIELLGIPTADRDQFAGYSDVLFDSGVSDAAEKRRRGIALAGYMVSLVDRLRVEPTPGLLSTLVASYQENRMTRSELVNLGLALLTAGYETTADQIGMSILAYLGDEHLHAALLDAQRRPGAIEEMLRLLPATPISFLRVATERLRLGGVSIEPGEAVFVSILAVNRDASRFDCPHLLAVDGHAGNHLTFGSGPHYCLGAPLARIQLSIAIGALLRRLPTARPAGPEAVAWKTGRLTCGLERLMVIW